MSSSDVAGTTKLTREIFDFAGRVNIEQRTTELEARHELYVSQHPQIQMTLHDFMQSLLFHKPEDPLPFMQKYFQDLQQQGGGKS